MDAGPCPSQRSTKPFNPRTNGGRDNESDVAFTFKSVDNELIC